VGGGCCKVETGDGELERGEEVVEAGGEAGDTWVDGGEAPCTEPGRGDPPLADEDGVDDGAPAAPWGARQLPGSACPSARGGGTADRGATSARVGGTSGVHCTSSKTSPRRG
jgi:hypothetical protein